MQWHDTPLVYDVKYILGELDVPISRTRLYEALRSGELVNLDLGGKRLIARENFMAWIKLDPATALTMGTETAPSSELRAVPKDDNVKPIDSDIARQVS